MVPGQAVIRRLEGQQPEVRVQAQAQVRLELAELARQRVVWLLEVMPMRLELEGIRKPQGILVRWDCSELGVAGWGE